MASEGGERGEGGSRSSQQMTGGWLACGWPRLVAWRCGYSVAVRAKTPICTATRCRAPAASHSMGGHLAAHWLGI